MAETFVDIAIIEIDGVLCRSIKSLSVDPTDTKSPVKTMTPERRALGVTRGVAEFGVKITAAIQAANPEIDWHAWMLNNEARNVVYDLNGDGKRISLRDVYISSISEKFDESGEASYDIDGFALDRKEDN
jgi:hypothetical protein